MKISFLAFRNEYSGTSLYTFTTQDRAPPLFCSGFLNFSSIVLAYWNGLCEDTSVADYTRSWCWEFTCLTRDYNFLEAVRVNLKLWGEMPHVYSNPVMGDSLSHLALLIKILIREGACPDHFDWHGKGGTHTQTRMEMQGHGAEADGCSVLQIHCFIKSINILM